MVVIFDPVQLTHPKLQELAVSAAIVSVLAETVQELEELLVDVPPEARAMPDFSTPWPWEIDAVGIAHFVVQGQRQEGERFLEEQLSAWLGEDRENWPVLRLTLIDPWQERPGIWSEHTPEWVRILATSATTVHENEGRGQS
jgi:hypothetical protein